MLKNKLHIISFDGLSKVDMDFLKKQENFSKFLDGASYSFEVKSIYPTLTYPAHTSIVTGNYPNKHGIINNTFLQPGWSSPDWYWHEKHIKTKTFQQLATENGYSVACFFWPVTAGSKIKLNMPEIFANRKWDHQILTSLRSGSKKFQLDVFRRYSKYLDGIKQPQLDTFTHAAYLHALKNYETDITMVHYTDLDTNRHEHGFSSKEAFAALERHDKRLGEIIATLKELGQYEKSTLVVLGDHSSKDADRIIFLNTIFEKQGLLTRKNGKVLDYEVIAKDAGGSTYVYSKGNKSFDYIKGLIEENVDQAAIEEIFTGQEAGKLGADPTCLMMIEANEGFLFEDGFADEPVVETHLLEGTDIIYHTNNHGYSPYTKKDYETVFIAKGLKIKENVNIGPMCLIDEGPTFAKILGLELKNTDGRVLEEIILGD